MTDSRAERRAALIAALLVVPLAVLTTFVVLRFGPFMRVDGAAVRALHGSVVGGPWVRFFNVVATVGQPWTVRAVCLVLAVGCGVRRQRRTAVWIVTVLLVTPAAWITLKALIQRPRPDLLHQISGWSFPSGHASEIAAGMGVLVVVTLRWVHRRRLRRGLVVTWVALAVLVGTDRVFLGAHYPSDVVGGWLVGTSVVVVSSALFGLVSTEAVSGDDRPQAAMPENFKTPAVILNPVKVSDPDSFKARVGKVTRAAGWEAPLWFETTIDDAGSSMARAAVAAGADVVVVAGGDGTVRVVCAEMAGTGVPVGVIPIGTGNLLARNLGIPLVHEAALDVALRGQDRAIDAVRIEGDALPPTRFVVMAGLGLDAAIMDGAPDALKARLGWPAYLVAAARHLHYPVTRVDIAIDDHEPFRRLVRTAVIGNAGLLQAGIPLMPDARIDDGVLDVVIIAPRRLFGWVDVVLRLLTKQRGTDERLDRYTGRAVTITAAHSTPRQLDGDTVAPGTRLTATIEPGRLLVRVPRSGRAQGLRRS